uniref:Uncharacterized protein n=1 Tax=Nelumbo nucifera TaxID=4432 RepID=A0A822XJH4_NELNU|nr:TPA_asm: hypothetical protein HUJ06_020398 [Nelumbo nucifera]
MRHAMLPKYGEDCWHDMAQMYRHVDIIGSTEGGLERKAALAFDLERHCPRNLTSKE